MSVSQIWTLKRASDGLEQTLAAWGITGAQFTRRTQRSDTLDIRLDGMAFDGIEAFPYGSTITLKRSGTVYFVGIAVKTPRMGRPNAEGVSYSFEGPWWYLDHITYQQDWQFLNFESVQAVSQLVLFQANDGTLITTGAQIADVVSEAISAGAALQMGTNDCAITIPPEGGRDLSCAEVIRRTLRWHPDVVTWFDYSFSPPKLNIRQRANLTSQSFAVAGAPHSGIDIAARPDLQTPVVLLKYQILNESDGIDESYISVDQYPAMVSELQPGAIVMTIDLQGTRSQYVKQYIKTETLAPTSLTWWKERLPHLNDANISSLAIVGSSSSSAPILADGGATGSDPGSLQSTTEGTVYGYNLVEGEIPEWMSSEHAQMALVQVMVNYDVTMETGVVEHHTNEVLMVKVMSTDLVTGWYKQLTAIYVGDPQPTGLAEAYYNALSALQYEGTFEITEQECGSTALSFLGLVLNLTGGLTAWGTMNALIFETTENLTTGKTRMRFGPATYLSPKDWVDLSVMNRKRQQGDLYGKVNGLITLSSTPVGGSGKHDRGQGGSSKAAPSFDSAIGDYTLSILPTKIDAAGSIPSNLTAKWRPITICIPDGMGGTTQTTALVLMSETYTPP